MRVCNTDATNILLTYDNTITNSISRARIFERTKFTVTLLNNALEMMIKYS